MNQQAPDGGSSALRRLMGSYREDWCDVNAASPIRVMIVDDHPLVREGLRLSFDGTDVQVAAEASNGAEAFERLKEKPIDVALCDLRMPVADGWQFLQMLQDAGYELPLVLVYSVSEGSAAVRRCRELGARGLLPKWGAREDLLAAVRRIHAGEEVWEAAGPHAAC